MEMSLDALCAERDPQRHVQDDFFQPEAFYRLSSTC